MNEQNQTSSQVMIKIDGARVRAIREAKGLTQLYIATAVDVTTDTVSRWENKRYPSIKRENGLKLAEALEVELEEILDTTKLQENSVSEAATFETQPAAQDPESSEPQPLQQPPGRRWYNNIGHLTIIVVTIVLVCAGIYLYSRFNRGPAAAGITATRTVPPHFIAGQPLPVFLHIEKADGKPVSIILKEDLPPGCRLQSAVPQLSGNPGNEIKWLTKVTQSTLFFYTVATDQSFSGDLSFTGTIKSGENDNAVDIGGDKKTVSGFHHWADTNTDNRISDEEILVVYDLLSGNSDQIIDLDQLEEMWLGDGYVWNPDQQQFTIME